jgi:hypothetical protein
MLPGRLYVCGPCVDFAAAAEADPGGRPPADLPEYSGVLATAFIRLLLWRPRLRGAARTVPRNVRTARQHLGVGKGVADREVTYSNSPT